MDQRSKFAASWLYVHDLAMI